MSPSGLTDGRRRSMIALRRKIGNCISLFSDNFAVRIRAALGADVPMKVSVVFFAANRANERDLVAHGFILFSAAASRFCRSILLSMADRTSCNLALSIFSLSCGRSSFSIR